MTPHANPAAPRTAPALAGAGAGLRNPHYRDALAEVNEQAYPDLCWFEVHPENFMGDGGPPHACLEALREAYPLSLHGVGLSLGGEGPLDRDHLTRLRKLIDRYQPELFSEHLAWTAHDGKYLNDLLPLPYDDAALARVVEHVELAQEHLARSLLLENPATYLRFDTSRFSEIDFLREVSAKTGCGLLLDVNNVFVSAHNHGFDAVDYIKQFPAELVGEIHVAGHAADAGGADLLIDSHDRLVANDVWQLLDVALDQIGAVPVLVEWDNELPAWSILAGEVMTAAAALGRQESSCLANHAH